MRGRIRFAEVDFNHRQYPPAIVATLDFMNSTTRSARAGVPRHRLSLSTALASLAVAIPLIGAPIPQPAPLPAERSIAPGPFAPTWESLVAGYKCPDWFRDAKFGIWAHWSAQCVPEQGDWYARAMYIQGTKQNLFHVANYGHPSEFGFMELNHRWTAERWDPEKLMQLYIATGAKYFVAMANHEDNFDAYNSRYQAWNSVNVGPRRDIVGTWAKVARAHGLHFGVSNHSSHAWHWFQTAYGYDPEGPKAGVRYDAFQLKKEDGRGKWWDGLDPQELYCRPCKVLPDGITANKTMRDWHDANNLPWTEDPPPDDPHFVNKWFFRLQDLIDQYNPDFLYLDNTELPLGQAGLDIAAHYYNASLARRGKLDVVLTAKGLKPEHRGAVVQDFERSVGDEPRPLPFETGTCIGQWHYKKDMEYKSPAHVLRILVDVVSKNGTLLLSVPQRGDGTIDEREVAILQEIGRWMKVNGEAIYGTRPWKIYGEGPTRVPRGRGGDAPLPYSQEDFRFTTKDGALFVFVMAPPTNDITIKALGSAAENAQPVASVSLVGSSETVAWKQETAALILTKPAALPAENVFAYKVTFQKPVSAAVATAP